MQIRIKKLSANASLSYATQEGHRRRLTLLACRFNGSLAYILLPSEQVSRLPRRFTVVIEDKERLPIMKQHMKMQMTGVYQTHQTVTHRYVADIVDTDVRQAPLYIIN